MNSTAHCQLNAAETATANPLPPQSDSLKIALLGYRSHPFVGGQGIYLKYLSRALAQHGHDVHVYSGQPYPELDDNIKLIKIPSLNLYESANHVRALRWHHLRSFTDTYEWWTMLTGGFGEPYSFGRRVAKKLRHSDYDIIHDNQSLSSGLLSLQKYGHTVVSTIHHPIHRDLELALREVSDWGMRLLVKRWHSFLGMQVRVVKKLHHVITVSKQSQSDIAHYFQRETTRTPVIFNGIDTSVFAPQTGIEENFNHILTTSSSDQPLKGLRFLLEAIASLRDRHTDIQLTVIGKLKPNGSNALLIKKLKLEQHVHFKSELSTEELVQHYNSASIVVCPSLYEGFGLPAAEAMACGKPVVATNGGALPEVIGDAGRVVPAGDAQALTAELDSLLNNPDTRQKLGQKARQRALSTFCWTQVAHKLTAFYHTCLAER